VYAPADALMLVAVLDVTSKISVGVATML